MNRTLLPKLRFPEFQDEWEEKRLDEIASFYKGKGISKADVNSQGKTPCIRYGELYTIYGEVINTVFSKTNLPASDLFLSKKNDVLIPSSGETKIDIAKASCVLHDDIALGGDLNILRTEESGIFLSYLINGAYKREIAKKAQGDTVAHLYANQLKLIQVAYPSKSEQQKIADCLTSLDDLIAAQSQKVETLQAYKKGLMQNLFPAEGESVPRLRFPEFESAGEWEEKTLGEVCDMKAGEFISASDISEQYQDGLHPCYGGNGLRGYTKTFTHSGQYSLIGRQGALCGNINLGMGQFYATEHALVVTPKENIDVNWLFYNLGFLNLNQYATGQAQPGLSVTTLEKVKIIVPTNTNEQQRIAELLSALDEQISAQGEALAGLKVHKRGLMQGLFP